MQKQSGIRRRMQSLYRMRL